MVGADGSSEGRLVASSPFPRHSVYDGDGVLVDEQGVDDFESWHRQSAGASPWSDDEAGAELDRELDRIALQNGAKLQRRRLGKGETLVEQGKAGCDMFLLVDGVLDVEVDGVVVAQVGSGAAPRRASRARRRPADGDAPRGPRVARGHPPRGDHRRLTARRARRAAPDGLAAGGGLAAAEHRVERHGGEEDHAGGD